MIPALLERRAVVVRSVRAFFDERGFVEVETPVRIAAPAPEEHIDCPAAPLADGAPAFLRASPELQMKKLLAAGMDCIYQIGPCFREGERGSRHSPEFTMLEWYRRGAGYMDIADDLEGLLRAAADAVGSGDRFAAPLRRMTVREAYLAYAGWDPWESFDADRFDFDMATKIEPAVKACGGGVFLADYPISAASLAKVRDDVAAEMGCCRRLAETLFRRHIGSSILNAIRKVRLEKAYALLRNKSVPIDAIPSQCGYAASPAYLKTYFRRQTGLTMREWRAKEA